MTISYAVRFKLDRPTTIIIHRSGTEATFVGSNPRGIASETFNEDEGKSRGGR